MLNLPNTAIPISLFIVSTLLCIISWFAKKMHAEALGELKAMNSTLGELTIKLAVHDEKLQVGNTEFFKIANHQKEQDDKIMHLETRMHVIEARQGA